MLAATRLSLLHASTMDRLASKHQLWMHTVRTDYRGDQVEAWTREPPGTTDSWHLVHAARDAHHALDRAVRELIQALRIDLPVPQGWPPDPPAAERSLLPQESAVRRSSQRTRMEVGR